MEIQVSGLKAEPLISGAKSERSLASLNQTQINEWKEALASGFLSIFTFADFFMCSLILKTFLAGNAPIESTEAAAYMTGFYSITLFAMNVGVVDSQGIYCAQAFSVNQFEKINLLLRQSIVISLILFFIIAFPLSFYVPSILPALGVREDLIGITQSLVFYMMPALIFRMGTDSFKAALQG